MSREDKERRALYPLIAKAIEKGYTDLGCGLDISVAQAITPNMYNALMNAGYRKASDVAEEIFEEIERSIFRLETPYQTLYCIDDGFIAELKKKYTGEDTNVGSRTEEEK